MSLGQSIGSSLGRAIGTALSGGAWSPLSLFQAGEQGAWYDPSDFSTMFQDSAGTTPVTAVEQPVGKILDKSGRGNHATQATTAQKPTLSARKNLLLQTESLGTAPWSIVNTTVTPSQAANATGQMTLCKVMATATAATTVTQVANGSGSAAGNTFRFLARKGSGATDCNTFGMYNSTTTVLLSLFTVNYDTGAVAHSYGSGATMTALGGGLWEVKQTITTGISTGNALQIYGGFTGNVESAGKFAYVGEYQLEASTTATTYQRVTTATDYDTVGFPHYLKFDGVDDGLATAAIDFTATDKMTVIAGVRKLSDAAQGCIAELTASVAANNGSWLLAAPDAATATFAFDSKGTVQIDAVASGNAAPMTAVLTGLADIAGDSCALRVNGAVGDTDVGDQGTGNYSNAALYIGRRGGTSLPFNGRLYQLIVRGAATASLTDLETYVNSKTGAY